MVETVKLDLGAGDVRIAGFEPIDIKDGKNAFPLEYPDGSVDEIRASHLLEHFAHGQTGEVLTEWVRALKPGGRLRVAVPDLDRIVDRYRDESDEPIEGYLMGGQVDKHDVHLAIFNREKLEALLEAVGLVDIGQWTSEVQDCASFSISLNLQGTKPNDQHASGEGRLERAGYPVDRKAKLPMRVMGAMSVPRLGFMDNYFCAFNALVPLGVNIRRHAGAYWGQCLERCLLQCLDEGAEAIITLDYDTVFLREDVRELVRLLHENPEVDAIAALQIARSRNRPLMTVKGPDHQNKNEIPLEDLQPELMRVNTAHFGLTIIRASTLKQLPHPWFKGEPAVDGTWSEARTDDDIWFWRQWEKHGRSLYLANRVTVGHLELMVRWPDSQMRTLYQHPSEFFDGGKPKGAWK